MKRPLVILLWILAVILFLSPFFRGLYFREDQLPFAAVVMMLLAAGLFLLPAVETPRPKTGPPRRALVFTWFDVAALLYAGGYLLSFTRAVSLRGAVGAGLNVLAYLSVYWLVSRMVARHRPASDVIMGAWLLSALATACFGLACGMGWTEYPDAVLGGRLCSTLQYPNTLAAFMLAGSVAAVCWGLRFRRPAVSALVGASLYVMLAALLLSGSRGALLLVPLAYAALLAGLPRGHRLAGAWWLASGLLMALALASRTREALFADPPEVRAALLALALGASVTAAAVSLPQALTRCVPREARGKLVPLVGAVAATAVGAAMMICYRSNGTIIPAYVIARFRHLNLENVSTAQRWVYLQTGLRALRDYWLTGAGGGGWDNLFYKYQPFHYFVSTPHNHFLETWLEGGLLAFLGLLAIPIVCLLVRWRAHRAGAETRSVSHLWGAGSIAIALWLSGAVDFSLTFVSMSTMLWCMLGVTAGLFVADSAGVPPKGWGFKWSLPRDKVKLLRYAGLGLLILLVSASAVLWRGAYYQRMARGYIRAGDPGRAYQCYRQANKYDPLDAETATNLTMVYTNIYAAKKEKGALALALREAQRCVRLEPYNPRGRYLLVPLLVEAGGWEPALDHARTAVELGPYRPEPYPSWAWGLSEGLMGCLEEGEMARARDLAEELISVPEVIGERIAEASRYTEKGMGRGSRQLILEPLVCLYAAKGHYFLRQWEQAESLLLRAMEEEPLRSKAEPWLYMLYKAWGNEAGLESSDPDRRAHLERLREVKEVSDLPFVTEQ